MRGKRVAALIVAGCVVALAATAAGVGKPTQGSANFIFAGAADPTYLDPALVSDGESFRVTKQIFESLVELRPGTTQLQPALATRWKVGRDGRTWTFTLRRNVRFHDGTRFNAAAVCANFNRWYNFSGPFQDPSATYYYRQIFGGFRRNEVAGLGPPLYQSCRARGQYTAIVRLRRRSGPFIPSLVLSAFSMQSPTAMRRYGANQGELRGGTFRPTGSYAFQHPTGTGPYRFGSWTVGQRVVLERNNRYWGRRARVARIIIRPISNNTARLQALQTGEVNGYDLVAPQDIPTIRRNGRLRLLNRAPFNVAYVTINTSRPPMNNKLVRRAVAHGLDRASVVRSFYGGRGVVAHQFMPPSVPGYNPNVRRYPFNPERARQLLRQAGLTLPVPIEFWWPTNVSRPYMPSPNLNAAAFAQSLERSGFNVTLRSAPWRPDYVGNVNSGTAGHLNIIGWTGDYADPDNFVGTFFQNANPQFGLTGRGEHGRIARILNAAEREIDTARRVRLYREANRLIMEFLPGVPYAHTTPAVATERRVTGYRPSPVGTESFYGVQVGGQ
ncbi:MAG: ABC transporter substrate-binding protein [Actinomycetota bacterium]|nr:ABC transporter substrate-binding protein [Actinomycetota bacterium]